MKKIYKTAIRMILGFGILFYVFYKVGLQNVYDNLSKISPSIVFIVLVFYVSLFLMAAANYKILLDALFGRLNFFKILRYNIESWSLGLFLPSKLGDFIFPFLIKKEGLDVGKTTAAVFLDRAISLIVLLFIALIGSIFIMPDFFYKIAVLIAAASACAFMLFFKKGRKLIKYVLGNKAAVFAGFHRTLMILMTLRRRIFFNIMISMLQWLASLSISYLLFLGQGIKLPFFEVIFLVAIARTISLIPVTMAGLGLREMLAVTLFNLFGVLADKTLAVYTFMLMMNYAFAAIVLFGTAMRDNNLRSIMKTQNVSGDKKL